MDPSIFLANMICWACGVGFGWFICNVYNGR